MRRFRGVLRDLTWFASSIGYGLEQFTLVMWESR